MSQELEDDHKKAQLLKQLEELGYHKSGRKQRSDKGQPRGTITKAQDRETRTKMAIYQKVKSQMYNKDQRMLANGGYGTFLDMDENSFLIAFLSKPLNSSSKSKDST